MFIELSDGTIINTDQIAIIHKGRYQGYVLTMACGDTVEATEQERSRINSATTRDSESVFRERVRKVLSEEMRRS